MNAFNKRFIQLLISQREKALADGKNPDRKGFKTVGEILGSEEFINYTKEKNGNGKRMSV